MTVPTTEAAALPARPRRTAARLAGCTALVALLGACATRPMLSSQQESDRYRSHAGRGDYTPPGPASDPWGPYVREAAAKYDVPERWIREVMRQESGGKLYHGGSLVTSGAGAMGLMQVMPATYDDLRRRYPDLTDDPYDPHNSILAGAAYIREMYDIYGSPGFLAAYNAGPGRMDDYLTRNRTLPEETRRYMASIGPRIAGTEPRNPSPGQQYAMNATPYAVAPGPRYAETDRYTAPTGYIRLNPPAPIVLAAAPEPILPAPAPPAPVRTADAGPYPGGPYIVLRPQPVEAIPAPIEVAALDLAPPTRPAPAPGARDGSVPAVFVPFERTTARPTQFAQLPEPPPPPPPPRTQQQLAAAALVPLAPRGSGFSLIAPAHAESIAPRRAGFSAGSWSVQVGAFANQGLAASATTSAREHAYEFLGAARPTIMAVREPHGTLYRARLGGMSRDTAAQACERLVRTRSTCMIISPDAQS